MRYPCIVLATAATFAWSGTLFAQSATTPPPTTTTTTTGTTTVSNAGAYDKLSDGNKKIVSAIYEAQLGSPNDTTQGQLLTRDDIAAMRQDTGWGNVYHQLQQQGLVTEKNLGQAISSHNHGTTNAGSGVTVVTTAGGEQVTVSKGKSGTAATSAVKSGNGNGNGAAGKAETGKSTTVVTTAAGSTAGANAAATSSANGVRAGGNGNGNGQPGGSKVK